MSDETITETEDSEEFEEPTPGPTTEEIAAEEAEREDVQVQQAAGEAWEARAEETRGSDEIVGGDDALVGQGEPTVRPEDLEAEAEAEPEAEEEE